jgi:hypothetical protein
MSATLVSASSWAARIRWIRSRSSRGAACSIWASMLLKRLFSRRIFPMVVSGGHRR